VDPTLPVADALFGKTRQAVLALLFGNPGRAYYTREIVHAVASEAEARDLLKLATELQERTTRWLKMPRRGMPG